jgi:hypothetical protein
MQAVPFPWGVAARQVPIEPQPILHNRSFMVTQGVTEWGRRPTTVAAVFCFSASYHSVKTALETGTGESCW